VKRLPSLKNSLLSYLLMRLLLLTIKARNLKLQLRKTTSMMFLCTTKVLKMSLKRFLFLFQIIRLLLCKVPIKLGHFVKGVLIWKRQVQAKKRIKTTKQI